MVYGNISFYPLRAVRCYEDRTFSEFPPPIQQEKETSGRFIKFNRKSLRYGRVATLNIIKGKSCVYNEGNYFKHSSSRISDIIFRYREIKFSIEVFLSKGYPCQCYKCENVFVWRFVRLSRLNGATFRRDFLHRDS